MNSEKKEEIKQLILRILFALISQCNALGPNLSTNMNIFIVFVWTKKKKRNEIFLYEKVKSTAVFHSELGDLKSP